MHRNFIEHGKCLCAKQPKRLVQLKDINSKYLSDSSETFVDAYYSIYKNDCTSLWFYCPSLDSVQAEAIDEADFDPPCELSVQCMEFIAGGAYGSGRFSIGLGLGILQRRINSYLAANFVASVAKPKVSHDTSLTNKRTNKQTKFKN